MSDRVYVAIWVALIAAWVTFMAWPALAGRGREATLQASFIATPIQGPTCFAPCVVHLESTATGDTIARPFHDLSHTWNCGNGTTGVAQPISSCTFPVPGTYKIVLRVDYGEDVSAYGSQSVTVASALAAGAQVMLAAGSRQTNVQLPAGPGVLTSAPGAPAVLTGGLVPPSGWTISGVDFEGGGIAIAPERSGITVYRSHFSAQRDACLVSQTGGGLRHSDRIAMVDSTCAQLPTTHMPAVFLRGERMVIVGNGLSSVVYPVRTVHWPLSVIARNTIHASGPGSNCAQLRAWGGTGTPNTPSARSVFAENTCTMMSPTTAAIRTCQTNTCDNSTSTAADVKDILIRGNTIHVVGQLAVPPPSLIAWVQGGGITVEDNTADCPFCNLNTPGTVRLVQTLADSTLRAGLAHDSIHARRNRAVLPAGQRRGEACTLSGADQACESNVIERVP